ncbi:hypothetical protein [Methyloglobulus sp.]|uniref:hypothetical protein n=1 Tax=Methyloglobulus sp. TaxID=2518622 RepID=UPI0032B75015
MKRKNALFKILLKGVFISMMPITTALAVVPPTPTTLTPLPLNQPVPVVPLPAAVFKTPATINGWIANEATTGRTAMKAHGWDLFINLMKPLYKYSDGSRYARLFDTWHSLDEAVPDPTPDPLNPGSNAAINFSTSPIVRPYACFDGKRSVDVKYNVPVAQFIRNTTMSVSAGGLVNNYNPLKNKVTSLTQPLPPLNFANPQGVMLKPYYTVIKGNGATIINRWDEAQSAVNPLPNQNITTPVNVNFAPGITVAAQRNWTKRAIVFPPGVNPATFTGTYYGRFGNALVPQPTPASLVGVPVFQAIKDFHYVKLSAANATALANGLPKELKAPMVTNIAAGDVALLTGLHIATREIDTWTWHTFWWEPQVSGGLRESDALNGVPADLSAVTPGSNPAYFPLKHFRAGAGYKYTASAAPNMPIINSNPYLEGHFGNHYELTDPTVFGASTITGVDVFIARTPALDPPYIDWNGGGVTYVHEGTGLKTNCITCHLPAAYPADSLGQLPSAVGKYPDYGSLSGTERLFYGRVRTHFLWGLANKATGYTPYP